MKLPRFSARRPVLTVMVTLMVLVIGLVSARRLRIDMLPEVELPTLTIRTEYQGAAPEVMEQQVTQIVEEIVATVPGVEEIESISSEGASNVQVRFAWGTDIDTAAIDVQGRIEDEIGELPENIQRPRVNKFDASSFPIVLLGISSQLDPVELTTLVEEQVRYRLAQIPGVAQVDPWGSYEREIRVELDLERVLALRLPLNQIVEALRDTNLDPPAGSIDVGKQTIGLRAPSKYLDLHQIRETVVAVRDGAQVRLGQIARVEDSYRKLQRIARVNGEFGLRVAIRKEANSNTVEVAESIVAEAERISRDFPQLNVVPVINQGNFIERSIQNVARSVLYGGALAVMVLLFFLRSWRSTAVIALSIPVSMVATFGLMYFAGLTINLMTLGGLALGVGMMVDNSIVVLENIFRRRDELRESRRHACVEGASEVAPAIVASTVTTLVIFLPLVFIEGVTAVLFRDLGYVIVFSLLCSLVVSLSVVPVASGHLLRQGPSSVGGGVWTRVARRAEVALRRLQASYVRLLLAALRRRWLTVGAAFSLLAASLATLPYIGTEFFPPSDEGEVRVSGEMPVGTKLPLVDRQTRLLERYVYEAVPEASGSVVSVGSSGYRPRDASMGQISLALTPASERERSNREIAEDLRQLLQDKVPGMTIRTRAPQGQFLLERILGSGEEDLTIEVRGFELAVLDRLAHRAAEQVRDVEGITDLRVSREESVPQYEIRAAPRRAADVGLTPRDVATALETAVAGVEAGEYRVGGNAHRILVQLEDVDNLAVEQILDLPLAGAGGRLVPLRSVVDHRSTRGPMLIDRKNQQRVVSLTANIAGRDLGSVVSDVRARLQEVAVPSGYDLVLSGSVEEQEGAFHELSLSLLLALALVYMVLAAQYESLKAPLIVMLSIPVAAIGVLLMLASTATTLNVQSFIGCIMLAGIVVNNAILLVDQAARLRQQGMEPQPAVVEAGRRRLRPILMTTCTTLFAVLPLAFGVGEGAEAQAPMARAVLGGLLASTAVTLVLIPAVYTLFYPAAARAASTEPESSDAEGPAARQQA